MARRKLTPEREQELARQAEERAAGGEGWDFAHPKRVNRGPNPTVVLSARIPVMRAQMLRRIASARRLSLSELVKEALENYAASPGPHVSHEGAKTMTFYGLTSPGAETLQSTAKRFPTEQTSTERFTA